MKILGIVGSQRKGKNTDQLIHHIVTHLTEQFSNHPPNSLSQVESEIVYSRDWEISPCNVSCSQYCSTHAFQCAHHDDFQQIFEKMVHADLLIIGCPLYFRAPPAQFHTFVERLISIHFYYESQGDSRLPSPLENKVCGLVATTEYSNPHQILEYLVDMCMVTKMAPVHVKTFPYLGVAGQGDLKKDNIFKPFAQCDAVVAEMVHQYRHNEGRTL